jgi:Chaperone of endosialidase
MQFESGVGVLGELNAFNGLGVAGGLKVNGGAQLSGTSSAELLSVTSQLRVTGSSSLSDLWIDGVANFGFRTDQKLNLFGTDYGIGVQPNTLYFRAAAGPSTGFAWFLGGLHTNALAEPGYHGFRLMRLDGDGLRIEAGAGSLTLGSPALDSGGQITFRRSGDESKGFDVQLANDAPGRLSLRGNLAFGIQTRQMLNLWSVSYGIGVQSSAMYFRTDSDFYWFMGGSHSDSNANPGTGGQALMKLSREGRIGLGTDSPSYPIDVRAGAAVGRWTSTNNGFGSVLVLQNTTAVSPSSYLGAINFETATTTSGQIGYLANHQMTFRVGGQQRMIIDAAGNVAITGTLSQTSDRNAKQEIHPVDTDAVLKKVVELPIAEWSYRQDPSTRHVGPMAQDFHAAFGLGPDDRHITTVDADGVALAAIQGLHRRLEEARRENAELRERLERLERRMAGGTDR